MRLTLAVASDDVILEIKVTAPGRSSSVRLDTSNTETCDESDGRDQAYQRSPDSCQPTLDHLANIRPHDHAIHRITTLCPKCRTGTTAEDSSALPRSHEDLQGLKTTPLGTGARFWCAGPSSESEAHSVCGTVACQFRRPLNARPSTRSVWQRRRDAERFNDSDDQL
jgi:hypothetical protein